MPLQDVGPLARASTIARWGFGKARTAHGRRSLARRIAFGALRVSGITPTVAVDSAGIRYHLSMADRAIGVDTFSDGSYDQHVMQLALNLIEERCGRPALAGREFADIGANVGTAGIPAVVHHGAQHTWCFEPDPDNFKLLRYNLIANDLESMVTAIDVGLSDRAGVAELERSPWNFGDHRVRTDDGAGDFNRETVTVKLDRFDDIVGRLGLDVNALGAVCLDVQGHEGFVLAGAESLVAAGVPIIAEYSPTDLRRAGSLDLLNHIIATRYRKVIDLRATRADGQLAELAARDITQVQARYVGTAYTDLLLLA